MENPPNLKKKDADGWENHRTLPSGYVKIAIENGHWNSGFTHWKWMVSSDHRQEGVYIIATKLSPPALAETLAEAGGNLGFHVRGPSGQKGPWGHPRGWREIQDGYRGFNMVQASKLVDFTKIFDLFQELWKFDCFGMLWHGFTIPR